MQQDIATKHTAKRTYVFSGLDELFQLPDLKPPVSEEENKSLVISV